MLIIAYPRDADFLARAPFEYQPEVELVIIDRLLDDERMLLYAASDLARSAPRALETGRRATPVEVTLRLACLRRLMGWSYRQLESEVAGSVKWRWFCRIYDRRVPDHSTLREREALLTSTTLHTLNDLTVQLGAKTGVTRGEKLRTDGSVVETHIHYPTDSGLLLDGVRVVGRALGRARAVIDGRTAPAQYIRDWVRWKKPLFRNRTRQARRLARQIGAHNRQRKWKKGQKAAISQKKMHHLYRTLIDIAQATVAQAQQVQPLLMQTGSREALALATTLEHYLALLEQVIGQSTRRVLQGEAVPATEKIVSVFEPHTAIIRRGKSAPRETEFGRKVWYSEVDGGLVSEYRLLTGNPPDVDQWPLCLEHHQALFDPAPKTATADRGVYTPANEDCAKQAGVAEIALPKPDAKTPARREHEAQPWFKAALRFRAGVEGRISVLRGARGLRRCLNRGEAGMERWVGWGVITNNLIVMATALAKCKRYVAKLGLIGA